MAGDLNKPVTTDGYENVLTYLRDNFAALVTLLDSRGAGASNLPENSKRWNNSNATFESWESSTWVVKTLSIAGGGTGATTAAAARAALGTNDAANITTGTLGSGRLPTVPVTKGGTGLTTLTSGSFLQGNGTGNIVLRTAAQVFSDLGLGTAAQADAEDFLPPVGVIMPYLGSTAPTGWLKCEGAAVSRSTYADLFNIVGTTYGAGDGTTTFNLPDFRGRTLIGAGQGSGLTNRALGNTGGAETHTLVTDEMPAHSHDIYALTSRQDTWNEALNTAGAKVPGEDTGSAAWYAGKINSAGGDGAHNNMQPFGVATWIIKY